jgi:crotonobetainyl-CoA:carnitine CoA-transferase CaiB-like acyl-CoA transferase
MTNPPLEGIRVVEVGVWVAGPAAGAILADWGADVVKIEPPTGDPMRGTSNAAHRRDVNPGFDLDNRGKRSVAINLQHPDGYRAARRLIDRADVFITNLALPAVERLRIRYEDLCDANPGLVYGRVTGFGPVGPDRDRPSFDAAAYWSRSGIMATLHQPPHDPPMPRGGFGDHPTALAAVAGIVAALFARTSTGRGQVVDTSLLHVGAFVLSWDLAMQLRVGAIFPQSGRRAVTNPLVNCYRAGDDRWFYLVNMQADRYWPGFCRAIERQDLIADPRFADLAARRDHATELVDLLDGIFATRPRAHWGTAFDREGVIWASVLTIQEVIDDPQAAAAGVFADVSDRSGSTARIVGAPVHFSETPARYQGLAPELGEHTEQVLLDLGYSWPQIAALKEAGAIL